MAKIIKNGIEYCGNTDYRVSQTATSNNADYEVLFSGTADNTTRTEGAGKSNKLTFNPSTGKINVSSIGVVDISSQYTFTKTSGTWNADATLYAYRMGNFVSIRLRLAGTGTQVNAGSDAFVGTISGGPTPLVETHDINFAGASAIVSRLGTNGSITTRVLASSLTVTSGNGVVLEFNFIT